MIMNDDLCSLRDHTLVAALMDHAPVVAMADIGSEIGNIHHRIFCLPQLAFDFARILFCRVNLVVHHGGERWLTIKQGVLEPRPLLQSHAASSPK